MRSLTATGAAWWGELERRERLLISAAVGLLVVSIGYFIIWEPMTTQAENMDADIATTEALFQRLSAMSPGQATRQTQITGRDQSLLSLLDKTAKSSGLGDAVKRIQPDGEQAARLWMEGADFSKTLRWLKQLKDRYGIEVADAVINREDAPGQVRARIGFERL